MMEQNMRDDALKQIHQTRVRNFRPRLLPVAGVWCDTELIPDMPLFITEQNLWL